MSAMRCLHCGVERALLKKLSGSENFCSEAHRLAYQEEFSRLALDRLLQSQPAAQKKSSPGVAAPAPPIKVMASPRPAVVEADPADPDPAGFLDDQRCSEIPIPRPISQAEPIFRNTPRAMPLSTSVIVNERNSRAPACPAPAQAVLGVAIPSPVQVAMTQEPPPVLPDVLHKSNPLLIAHSVNAPNNKAAKSAPVIPSVPKKPAAMAPAMEAKSHTIVKPGPVGRISDEMEPVFEATASGGFKMVSEIGPEPGFLKLLPMWAKGLALAAMLGGGAFVYVKFAG